MEVWIGVLGGLAHGAAAPLTILTSLPWARRLFPLLLLVAVWLLLTAVWPLRQRSRSLSTEAPASV
jgi:hypothetical protein